MKDWFRWCWLLVSASGCKVASLGDRVAVRHVPEWKKSRFELSTCWLWGFVSVWRSSVRSWIQWGWGDASHSFDLCAALIMSWVAADESWEPLKSWHFMTLRSLIFEIDMKELLPLSVYVSVCCWWKENLSLDGLWDLSSMSLLHFILKSYAGRSCRPGAPSQGA